MEFTITENISTKSIIKDNLKHICHPSPICVRQILAFLSDNSAYQVRRFQRLRVAYFEKQEEEHNFQFNKLAPEMQMAPYVAPSGKVDLDNENFAGIRIIWKNPVYKLKI